MRNFTVILVIIFASYKLQASEPVPNWLDTVPPRITIQPDHMMHSSVFHVTFSANEHSRIFYSINSISQMRIYNHPCTITQDGKYSIYYYGEDDYGNRSKIDSAIYILDTRPPSVAITPQSGYYNTPVILHITTDEPCNLFILKDKQDPYTIRTADSVIVKTHFEGYIAALDSAGNKTLSEKLSYTVDTTVLSVTAVPEGGVFNHAQAISFKFQKGVDVYYTFDPLAPPKWFTKYSSPVTLPGGLTIFRYYGKDSHGRETEIKKTTFVIDTIPPKLHYRIGTGEKNDTAFLYSKEKSVIKYTLDGSDPTGTSILFSDRILIPHKSKCVLKARCWDEAGNASEIITWTYIYDHVPPVISISPMGGSFTRPVKLYFTSDEPAQIFFTLDGTPADLRSRLFIGEEVLITKEDSTTVNFIGIDEAGNISKEKTAHFFLDTRPPVVRVKIEENLKDSVCTIQFLTNETATIYYETGGLDPGLSSHVYEGAFQMKIGQVLKYFAVDHIGNTSKIYTMDELVRPMISAQPRSGIYNRKLKVSFSANIQGTIFWRIPPDTVFKRFKDSLTFNNEGTYSIEYYIESPEGVKSAIRREDYLIDWTAPHTEVSLRKGNGDSLTVFFSSDENSTIYYTTDGTNPAYSRTTLTTGNKFLQSSDRISLSRNKDLKLVFYAEDIAGNQSVLSIMDLARPRAVPNIPAGSDKIYDRILSVSLSTFDKAAIYYERHGKKPTLRSPLLLEPITLTSSDTIIAFVVDASGYRGDLDTFIYHIDLPPSPQFIVSSDSVTPGQMIIFDAYQTIDLESPSNKLLFRWDFDGDGKFDTESGHLQKVSRSYSSPGLFFPVLEVTDELGRKASCSRRVAVFQKCPPDMASAINESGHSFCIDIYEWPDKQGMMPTTGMSWVEAKMACIDAGKRLCTSEEWVSACKGNSRSHYPYGEHYRKKLCPTNGEKVSKSGAFENCKASGAYDMIGNVWEWTEDKEGDYPVLRGGSFKYGKDANCDLKTASPISTKSQEAGFRCCR